MQFFARIAAARKAPPGVLASAWPPSDENLEPSIVEAVSRGSQEAFVMLFDRTAGTIRAELTARLPDPEQRVPMLAATYVEVWWLAGCHRGAESDVTRWIRGILDRRIADAHRATGRHVSGEPRPSRAELELAELLGQPIDSLWPV
jgi:hypothetical protein